MATEISEYSDYVHDTKNELLKLVFKIDNFFRTRDDQHLIDLRYSLDHLSRLTSAHYRLTSSDITLDTWITEYDKFKVKKSIETAMENAMNDRSIYHPDMNVNISIPDDLVLNTNDVLYKFLFNSLTNSMKSLRQKAVIYKKDGRPDYDFSHDPKIDIKGHTMGNKGVITIRDNGIGIKPDVMLKMTTKGFSGFSGTGLGIAYMDQVLPKVGMSYYAHSTPEKYAEFVFTGNLAWY